MFIEFFFFFFNDTATTEIYTLSLHDALPIYPGAEFPSAMAQQMDHETRIGIVRRAYAKQVLAAAGIADRRVEAAFAADRKSTRLNSSHSPISYAVFCLKKKNKYNSSTHTWTM